MCAMLLIYPESIEHAPTATIRSMMKTRILIVCGELFFTDKKNNFDVLI